MLQFHQQSLNDLPLYARPGVLFFDQLPGLFDLGCKGRAFLEPEMSAYIALHL